MDVVQPRDLGHHLSNLHVPASSQTVQGSELMKSNAAAEAALLLGGDLLVTVWQVRSYLPLANNTNLCSTYHTVPWLEYH